MATKTTTKKPAAKKPTKEDAPAKKTPGVIDSIVEFISGKAPATKDAIVAKLVARFPQREETALRRTVNCQLPGRLTKERGLKITKTEEGAFHAK
jgi:hypothetical protein